MGLLDAEELGRARKSLVNFGVLDSIPVASTGGLNNKSYAASTAEKAPLDTRRIEYCGGVADPSLDPRFLGRCIHSDLRLGSWSTAGISITVMRFSR